jgi:uncharacterized membrane protein (UPF0182 family)
MPTTGSGARMRRMRRSTVRWLLIAIGALLLTLFIGSVLVHLYTESLWFSALGRSDVLWTRIGAHVGVRLVAGAIGGLLVLINLFYVTRHLGPVHLRRRYGNLEIAEQVPRAHLRIGMVLVSLLAGWWLSGVQFGPVPALRVLAWTRAVPWGVADPLFHHDLSFYVFALPVFARFIAYLLLVVLWSALLAMLGYALLGAIRMRDNRIEVDDGPRFHFALLLAGLVLLLGAQYWLGRYDVLFTGSGFGGTVGYTDVHARLPLRNVLALLALVTTGAILIGAARRNWVPPLVAMGVLVLAGILGGIIYPATIQKLQVEPNQLARERPYIEWLITHTRRAFALDTIERVSWSPSRSAGALRGQLTPWVSQVPLWDAEPLLTSLRQQESRRPYYEFHDVDFDRYRLNGELRQVAVAIREFKRAGLPPDRQTWRNIHLEQTYTHGFGAVVTVASEAARGDPVFWLADLSPVERDPLAPPELELREPRVYFGETMRDYVVLNPVADSAGRVTPIDSVTSGVRLDSFLRVMAFAARFRDKNLLFSSDLGPESRLLFRRPVIERVRELAPFLLWDDDAYPVVWRGRVVWVLDGYSVTNAYPLSEPLELAGAGFVRYIRNSAKAVVDGVSGAVSMYAVTRDEPLLATYRGVFPDLFQELAALPADLRMHLRYPAALAAARADKLERFHVTSPELFYSGQEAWQRPEEASLQGAPRAYEPAFIIAALPGAAQPEFLLTVPFVAAERKNMTALLVVRSDAQHYGEAVLLDLPAQDVARGPPQVAALIEQDAGISAQLSLWRNRQSTVELGQIRVVPFDSAVLYVQPLFLSAAGSEMPQLQQVIVSDGTRASMAPTLAAAIDGLVGGGRTVPVEQERTLVQAAGPWAADALKLLDEADQMLRAGDWAGFGARWSELQALLQRAATAGTPR